MFFFVYALGIGLVFAECVGRQTEAESGLAASESGGRVSVSACPLAEVEGRLSRADTGVRNDD